MTKIKSLAINFAVSVVSVAATLTLVSFVASDDNNVQYLKEANKFKYELIQHQRKLIEYQDTMINSLANTLWNEYNDDCAQFDGEEQDNIDKEKQIIDSLYNTQQ